MKATKGKKTVESKAGEDQLEAMILTVDELKDLVEAGLSSRTKAAFAFSQTEANDYSEFVPAKAFADAIAEFDKLPLETRRAVCNGWNPKDITERPTRTEFMRLENEVDQCTSIYSIMEIGKHHTAQRFQFYDSIDRVTVQIRFGTTKAEALEGIRNAELAVLQHYHKLIDSNYCSIEKLDDEINHAIGKALIADEVAA